MEMMTATDTASEQGAKASKADRLASLKGEVAEQHQAAADRQAARGKRGARERVLALLDERSGASNQEPHPAALLARIAAQLQEIEAALAARNGLGSLVWRSRQAGEVLNA